MRYSILPLCLIIMFLIVGCDPHDGKLTLVNDTNDTIFFSLSYVNDSISYPVIQMDGKNYGERSDIIQAKDENRLHVMDRWEDFINRKCKDSIIRIFFFSKNLMKTAKDSIMKYQLCSQKEKLKVKDLEKLNWRIVYKTEH